MSVPSKPLNHLAAMWGKQRQKTQPTDGRPLLTPSEAPSQKEVPSSFASSNDTHFEPTAQPQAAKDAVMDCTPSEPEVEDQQDAQAAPDRKRKRVCFTPEQMAELEALWSSTQYPTNTQKSLLSEQAGVTDKQVSQWFEYQRKKARTGGAVIVKPKGNKAGAAATPEAAAVAKHAMGTDAQPCSAPAEVGVAPPAASAAAAPEAAQDSLAEPSARCSSDQATAISSHDPAGQAAPEKSQGPGGTQPSATAQPGTREQGHLTTTQPQPGAELSPIDLTAEEPARDAVQPCMAATPPDAAEAAAVAGSMQKPTAMQPVEAGQAPVVSASAASQAAGGISQSAAPRAPHEATAAAAQAPKAAPQVSAALTAEGKAALVRQLTEEMEAIGQAVTLHRPEKPLTPIPAPSEQPLKKTLLKAEIAGYLVGCRLPLSQLVAQLRQLYVPLEDGSGVTEAAIRNYVIDLASRRSFGVKDGAAAHLDALEDATDELLWQWELRDMKALPKLLRPPAAEHKKRMHKAQERLTALAQALRTLQAPSKGKTADAKMQRALDKLHKVDTPGWWWGAAVPSTRLRHSQTPLGQAAEAASLEGAGPEVRPPASQDREDLAQEPTAVPEDTAMADVGQDAQATAADPSPTPAALADKEAARVAKAAEKEAARLEKELARQQKEAARAEKEADAARAKAEKDAEAARLRAAKDAVKAEKEAEAARTRAEKEAMKADKEAAKKAKGFKSAKALEKSQSTFKRFFKTPGKPEGADAHQTPQTRHTGAGPSAAQQLVSPVGNFNAQMSGEEAKNFDEQIRNPRPMEAVLEAHKERIAAWKAMQRPPRIPGMPPSWARKSDAEARLRKLHDEKYGQGCDLLAAAVPLFRRKFLWFDSQHDPAQRTRPPLYRSWTRLAPSAVVRRRNFLGCDAQIDYDEDDEDWEEEPEGESLSDDDEPEEVSQLGGESAADGFVVDDGHLSEGEGLHSGQEGGFDDADEAMSAAPLLACSSGGASQADELAKLQRLICLARERNRPLIISRLPGAASCSADGIVGDPALLSTALRMEVLTPDVIVTAPPDPNAAAEAEGAQAEGATMRPAGTRGPQREQPEELVPDLIKFLLANPAIKSFAKAQQAFLDANSERKISKKWLVEKLRAVAERSGMQWNIKLEALALAGIEDVAALRPRAHQPPPMRKGLDAFLTSPSVREPDHATAAPAAEPAGPSQAPVAASPAPPIAAPAAVPAAVAAQQTNIAQNREAKAPAGPKPATAHAGPIDRFFAKAPGSSAGQSASAIQAAKQAAGLLSPSFERPRVRAPVCIELDASPVPRSSAAEQLAAEAGPSTNAEAGLQQGAGAAAAAADTLPPADLRGTADPFWGQLVSRLAGGGGHADALATIKAVFNCHRVLDYIGAVPGHVVAALLKTMGAEGVSERLRATCALGVYNVVIALGKAVQVCIASPAKVWRNERAAPPAASLADIYAEPGLLPLLHATLRGSAFQPQLQRESLKLLGGLLMVGNPKSVAVEGTEPEPAASLSPTTLKAAAAFRESVAGEARLPALLVRLMCSGVSDTLASFAGMAVFHLLAHRPARICLLQDEGSRAALLSALLKAGASASSKALARYGLMSLVTLLADRELAAGLLLPEADNGGACGAMLAADLAALVVAREGIVGTPYLKALAAEVGRLIKDVQLSQQMEGMDVDSSHPGGHEAQAVTGQVKSQAEERTDMDIS